MMININNCYTPARLFTLSLLPASSPGIKMTLLMQYNYSQMFDDMIIGHIHETYAHSAKWRMENITLTGIN